jgi:FAD/FMN-containing dehydrogenase
VTRAARGAIIVRAVTRASDEFIAALEALLPDGGLSTSTEDLAYFASDRCKGGWPVHACAIAFPRKVAEVQALLRCASQFGVAVVPSGGRTGLAGAATATAGELVVSLEKMRKVLELNVDDRWVRAEAGATIAAIEEAAREKGLSYPVDWAATGSAQVGGSIATNAGGIRVLRYGLTRQWVRGLKVVLASGELLELDGGVIKDATGYDLRQLFVGSEGTLGIIVEATMGLIRPPAGRVVALCSLPDDASLLRLYSRLRDARLTLSAFECFDAGCVKHVLVHRGSEGRGPFEKLGEQHAVVEVEVKELAELEEVHDDLALCLADAQDAGEIDDAVLGANEAQAKALWEWREGISESLHAHTPHKADVCLPVSRLSDFVAAWRELVNESLPHIEARCFGHVGDGNLHLNMLCPQGMGLDAFLDQCHAFDPKLYALVQQHQGSISAEHGIGLLKRDYLGYRRSEGEIASMRAIKRALDPRSVLNPGKIFE